MALSAIRPVPCCLQVRSAKNLDLVVTTGGASVGVHDHIVSDLNDSGGSRLNFWKIAMRPGKPLISGTVDGIPLIGLPGNPVSTAVCALVFLRPAIAHMTRDSRIGFGSIDHIFKVPLGVALRQMIIGKIISALICKTVPMAKLFCQPLAKTAPCYRCLRRQMR